MVEIEVLQDARQAAALMQPERLRVLQQLTEPESASGVARRLDLPRQQVNYHLRELEKNGLVEFLEERKKGNCMERVMRSKARSFIINPDVLGSLTAATLAGRDRFSSSYLLMAASRAVRDLAILRPRAEKAGKRLPTLTAEVEVSFANAEDRRMFAEELTDAIARLVAKHNANRPGSRTFRLLACIYPAITQPDDKGDDQ